MKLPLGKGFVKLETDLLSRVSSFSTVYLRALQSGTVCSLAPFLALAAGVAIPKELSALRRLDPAYRRRLTYHEAYAARESRFASVWSWALHGFIEHASASLRLAAATSYAATS